MTEENGSGRVTLRDVLQLVGESETRITLAVTDGFERIESVIKTHETDITALKADAATSKTVRSVVRVSFVGARNLVVTAVAIIGGVSGLVALLRG